MTILDRLIKVRENMGVTWCCHPSRRVKRLAEPLQDSRGTDIRRTFERYQTAPVIVVDKGAR